MSFFEEGDDPGRYFKKFAKEMLTVAVIVILALSFLMKAATETRRGASTFIVIGADFSEMRNRAVYYYAMNGQWGESLEDIEKDYYAYTPVFSEDFIEEIKVMSLEERKADKRIRPYTEGIEGEQYRQGAMDFYFSSRTSFRRAGGKAGDDVMLTIRPAVSEGDTGGPIIFSAGSGGEKIYKGFDFAGTDRTTVKDKYIARVLK